MSKPKGEWRCLRCKADQAWISRNRKKCLRCGAGREWLERSTDSDDDFHERDTELENDNASEVQGG